MRSFISHSRFRTLAVRRAAVMAAVLTVVISSCMTVRPGSADPEPDIYVPEDFRKFSSYQESEYLHAFRSQARRDTVTDHYLDP